jgi:hypothetical protein
MNKYIKILKKLLIGQYRPIEPPEKVIKPFNAFIQEYKDRRDIDPSIQFFCYNCNATGKECCGWENDYYGSPTIPIYADCKVCNGTKEVSKDKLFLCYKKQLQYYKEDLAYYKLQLQKLESITSKLTNEDLEFLCYLINH